MDRETSFITFDRVFAIYEETRVIGIHLAVTDVKFQAHTEVHKQVALRAGATIGRSDLSSADRILLYDDVTVVYFHSNILLRALLGIKRYCSSERERPFALRSWGSADTVSRQNRWAACAQKSRAR